MMIVIDGNPISKKRHRSCVNRFRRITSYSDQKAEEHSTKWKIKSAILDDQRFPIEGAVEIKMCFHLPISNSLHPIRKEQRANGIVRPTSKPDIDNLIKFYLDCCNGLLYKDDKQIVVCQAAKMYSFQPRTTIEIAQIDAPCNQSQ